MMRYYIYIDRLANLIRGDKSMTIYLSENIKRLRLEKELTQETLSEFLGVTS